MPARRDFRLLLAGQTTSQFGAQISGVAVPLLAVVTLHASPLQLGVVTAAGTFAFAVIGLPAGAWVDRWPCRPVLVASDLVRAGLLLTIPLSAFAGALTMVQLIVVSLLVGVARVFFDVGYQSYLPAVVGRDGVLAGNSAMETVRAGGQVAGPGLGGWLVALVGAANVVLIQAVTFAVSGWCLLRIKAAEPPAGDRQKNLRAEIREGLRFVLHSPVLRAAAMASGLGNFAFAVASAVNVVFMVRTLGLSPAAVGAVVALGSVTVMLGAALTPRLARRVGSARIVWVSLAVSGPVGLLCPLARPGWGVALLVVGMAAGELGQIIFAITNVSLRQRLCPARLLGRVGATVRVLVMGLFPLGALAGGALGEIAGVRAALWASGLLLVASAAPVYLALRHIRDVAELTTDEQADGLGHVVGDVDEAGQVAER